MPRVAPKPAVEPKAFRHVAVVVLALGGLLAMFASGESREEFERQLAENQERKRLEQAELELAKKGKGGNTTLVFKDKRRGSWGSDTGAGGAHEISAEGEGSPELVAASAPRLVNTPPSLEEVEDLPAIPPPGMTMEELLEAKRLQKRPGSMNKSSRKMSNRQIERMIEASRHRTNTPSG